MTSTSTANQQPSKQQSARNAAIAALAAQQLAQLWPQVDWTSPDAMSAVKTVYKSIVTRFGQAAATVAAEFYDHTRDQAGAKGSFRATPADPVPEVVLDKAVQSAFLGNPEQTINHGLVGPITTSDLPVEERVPARLDNALQRHVLQPARDTIVENVEADPVKPRYIRVPMGPNPCAFCIMLASRQLGPIDGPQKRSFSGYASAQSAQFVVGRGRELGVRRGEKRGGKKGQGVKSRGSQAQGDKYHDHCDCEPVAIFPGQDESDVSPNFDDYQDMYYKGTADAGTHRDAKKILASMRKVNGLR